MRAYEIRPEGVRARVDDSADSMKYRSLTEEEEGGEGRAHRRSRIPRFSVLSNGPIRAKRDGRAARGPRAEGPVGSPRRSERSDPIPTPRSRPPRISRLPRS